jgi:hypothetical protein
MDEFLPPPPPRLAGVFEHYNRIRWLLDSAANAHNAETRFAMLVMAVYPARAMVEIMLEAASKKELDLPDAEPKVLRDTFEKTHLAGLPHYLLIEKIRIHDFHRFGCTLSMQMMFGGPIKLSGKGESTILIPLHGDSVRQCITTGQAKIIEQRPLLHNLLHHAAQVAVCSTGFSTVRTSFACTQRRTRR